MKPAPFDYYRPTSAAEAVALLAEMEDEDVKLLAGGQSLVPLLNFRLAVPEHLVDIGRLEELRFIRSRGEFIEVGALSRHRDVEVSSMIERQLPLLAQAVPWIGHQAIRNSGTLGGSIAHADPAAELPSVAVALGAQLQLTSQSGVRTIEASDFFSGFLTTELEQSEILTSVRFPTKAWSGSGWLELARRHGDFALVGVAVLVDLDGEGVCTAARIVLSGVGSVPLDARSAATSLVGRKIDHATAGDAGAVAAEECRPASDIHGSDVYRRRIAQVLTRQAILKASAYQPSEAQ